MVMRSWRKRKSYGFTLIELLVVISIITLLVGIMSAGLHKMVVHARGLKQKAQLNAIEIGLEFFEKRYDILPDSKYTFSAETGEMVNGAQHLAEALLGRDEAGFDPKTRWHEAGEDTITDLYRNDDTTAEGRKSLNRRLGPFMDVQSTGAYTVDEIYGDVNYGVHSGEDWYRSPVITDVFGAKKIELANGVKVKVGSPVLYYKANVSSRIHKQDATQADYTGNPDITKWIYNFWDNTGITGDQDKNPGSGLPGHKGEAVDNVLTITKFYEMITNTKVSPGTNMERPYNAKSYLLISAGFDGIYGTRDDVTNFDY